MDMTVSVDDDLAESIEGRVADGRFHSSSDLVREALGLSEGVKRHDADRLRWLCRTWRDGIESGDAGEIDCVAVKVEARERRTVLET